MSRRCADEMTRAEFPLQALALVLSGRVGPVGAAGSTDE